MFATTVSAQVEIPTGALPNETDVQQVFRQGSLLEQQQRWGEALTHYEDALREFPGRQDIEQKLTTARIHYDVGRRYNDSSYVSALQQMQERNALDVYAEVLLKIQAHHVHSPDWQNLLERGTTQLDVALTDEAFLDKNLAELDQQRIDGFRRDFRNVMRSNTAQSRQEARNQVAMVARFAAQNLGISPQVVVLEYMCGALGALDMYSSYLTGAQLDDIMSQIEGNFVGLGIELKADQQSLLIVSVIPGGPAARAGVQDGDRIIEVDGNNMNDISTDAAANMLKGEEGSSVKVIVVAPSNVRRHLEIRRERVEVPSVEDVSIVDRDYGIGYLKLTSFQKTTLRDFDAALWKLHQQGMKRLIVDVRGNPGGLLTASVEVADKFVSSGTIVSTRGRSPREDFDYKAHSAGTWRVPLIVLVDGDSASASEIFAAAIKDNRRGRIVGERSFGKGSVQGIFPLNLAKAGVRLTTAKFYSPHGHPISDRGVQPDFVVRATAKPDNATGESPADNTDVVLNAGVQIARQQLSQR